MWSWRSGGGLGKAGGSVRQRTNKTGGLGGFGKARSGWRASPGAGAGWVAPKSESCELDANSLKSAKRPWLEAWNL